MPDSFQTLASQLSSGAKVIFERSQLLPYLKDTMELTGHCSAAVECATREDVIATIRFCLQNAIPFTPRGAGTGLSGGATPQGGVVISTTRMNSIVIDQATQRAHCGPGAITKDIQDRAAKYSLTYPPDPASYAESTIAGNIAENAGGLRCKRFGVTRDYVVGLEFVTPAGELMLTGSLAHDRGMNWTDLFTGSEGTLGILTSCELQLIPSVARGTTILAFFPTVRAAGDAVAGIVAAGIIPSVLEFMDGGAVAIALARQTALADFPSPSPILLIESNASLDPVQAGRIADICQSCGASWIRKETDPAQAETLWLLRRSLSRSVKSKAAFWLSEDVAVPVSRFAELVVGAAMLKIRPEVEVVSFGHAGDGNLHAVFMLANDTPVNRALIDQQVSKLMDLTLSLRGTITGEHGVGLAKRDFLDREFNRPTRDVMRLMQNLLDPGQSCNPGKIFR